MVLSLSIINLGDAFFRQGELKAAAEMFEHVIKIMQQTGDKTDIKLREPVIKTRLALILLELGQLEKAEGLLENAVFDWNKFPQLISRNAVATKTTLAMLYAKTLRYEKAKKLIDTTHSYLDDVLGGGFAQNNFENEFLKEDWRIPFQLSVDLALQQKAFQKQDTKERSNILQLVQRTFSNSTANALTKMAVRFSTKNTSLGSAINSGA